VLGDPAQPKGAKLAIWLKFFYITTSLRCPQGLSEKADGRLVNIVFSPSAIVLRFDDDYF
jgi:hypothetical protein